MFCVPFFCWLPLVSLLLTTEKSPSPLTWFMHFRYLTVHKYLKCADLWVPLRIMQSPSLFSLPGCQSSFCIWYQGYPQRDATAFSRNAQEKSAKTLAADTCLLKSTLSSGQTLFLAVTSDHTSKLLLQSKPHRWSQGLFLLAKDYTLCHHLNLFLSFCSSTHALWSYISRLPLIVKTMTVTNTWAILFISLK